MQGARSGWLLAIALVGLIGCGGGGNDTGKEDVAVPDKGMTGPTDTADPIDPADPAATPEKSKQPL